MITMSKYGDNANYKWMELFGLSTDTKPTKKFEGFTLRNSSTFYEMDTKKSYIFDEENHKWWEL